MPPATERAPTAQQAPLSLDALVQWFEALAPADLARLERVYTADARFIDPFNDVQGSAAIARIYGHMFEALDSPRFVVRQRLAQGSVAFLSWDFHFRSSGRGARDWLIHGATELHLAPDGRIVLHHDHWDAARQFYERLPVLGAVLRWLRGRLAVR